MENGVDGGEDNPSRLMEEKVSISFSSLPKDMTLRGPVDGDGERIW